MPTARARTDRTQIGRWVGAATAALVFTLLLGGLAAPLASAQTRQEAVDQANQFIAWCVASGGTPSVNADNLNNVRVTCDLPNGSIYVCTYWPTISCNYVPLTRPAKSIGDQLGGEGGVAASDPSAGAGVGLNGSQSGGVMSVKAATAGSHDKPTAKHRSAKPKHGKAANHQKSQAGKT